MSKRYGNRKVVANTSCCKDVCSEQACVTSDTCCNTDCQKDNVCKTLKCSKPSTEQQVQYRLYPKMGEKSFKENKGWEVVDEGPSVEFVIGNRGYTFEFANGKRVLSVWQMDDQTGDFEELLYTVDVSSI
jgi:hypothetical protein